MKPGMKGRLAGIMILGVLVTASTWTQTPPTVEPFLPITPTDSLQRSNEGVTTAPTSFLNAWGMDILISNDGFGLGTFYRREFNLDFYGFATLSISESKDEREIERFDPFTQISFVPGKLNRFFVIPLTFGVQQRLFRDDILDTFRPYVNIAAGPALVYSAPFTEITDNGGTLRFERVEFFRSLGRGRAYYTASAYIGVGANFGSDKNNLFGVNFRYYITHLFSDGLASTFDERTGEVANRKKDFGGFFITLNLGLQY